MSVSWRKRKTRLDELLNEDGDEDAKGLALDRIIHGQSVIGKTSRTSQIEDLKFGDKDLNVVGTLEYGQYGVIDVVTCKLDGKSYIRKSIEKRFALKTQDQCSPQIERDILLRALKSESRWAPHLLCAFQTPTHLNVVMEYAEGGTLCDVLESSPHDGRVLEADLLWWAPQAVSAIHWCHSQGFVHRDIKPNNFVLDAHGHLLLIDFGSAAPLLPPGNDGSQQVPKKHCLVPCGTCDYISPEILQCHEEALVELEMADDIDNMASISEHEPGGYGRETDWWSLGAMLYEMAYGVAPFFANEIKHTYLKIMDHKHSLRFHSHVQISAELRDLLKKFLDHAEFRLGRQSVDEVMTHAFFRGIKWDSVHQRIRPDNLHVPQFTYAAPMALPSAASLSASRSTDDSRPFGFSAFFQSSSASAAAISIHQPTTPGQKSILRDPSSGSFIGFSWGPALDAFKKDSGQTPPAKPLQPSTPLPQRTPFTPLARRVASVDATPQRFRTPIREKVMTPFGTVPGTVGRTAQKRAVSDREAFKQLVSCVGMSARKKVLESGRKPRLLTLTTASSGRSRASTMKELRFDHSVAVVGPDLGVSYRFDPTSASSSAPSTSFATLSYLSVPTPEPLMPSESDSSMDSEVLYSPSPSPRPSSAMSTFSKRSMTPASFSLRPRSASNPSTADSRAMLSSATDSRGFLSPLTPLDPPWSDNRSFGLRPPAPITPATKSVTFDDLDELQMRYERLMLDIEGLSGRLDDVAVRVGGRQ